MITQSTPQTATDVQESVDQWAAAVNANLCVRTDFTGWQRGTLERFAREVADENLLLRADLKTVLGAWRSEVEGAS